MASRWPLGGTLELLEPCSGYKLGGAFQGTRGAEMVCACLCKSQHAAGIKGKRVGNIFSFCRVQGLRSSLWII